MSTVTKLMTAQEYSELNCDEPTELLRGVVVEMNRPGFQHGEVCSLVNSHLLQFVRSKGLGRVIGNDSGVVTTRDPDSVRGPDVAYYSYKRVPKGLSPKKYVSVPPEIAIEVRSPTDNWADILAKVGEYLGAGVDVVCVVDPETRCVDIYTPSGPHQQLRESDTLTFPGILDGYAVVVRDLFE
jgi:Uma2 family endonuclease